jgi:hypothetical protein
MYISEDVDMETEAAKTKLTSVDSIISQQKSKVDSYKKNPSTFEELRIERPYVIEIYMATINALEGMKHISEIKTGVDILEKNFYEYSQGYVLLKRELGKN